LSEQGRTRRLADRYAQMSRTRHKKTAESKAARANHFFLSKKKATIAIIGRQIIINRKQVTEMSSLIEEETRLANPVAVLKKM